MGRIADIVLEVIGYGGTAHGIEQVGAECAARDDPPRSISQQCLEVAAQTGTSLYLDMLAGQQEAADEQTEADGGNDHHGSLPGTGLRVIEGFGKEPP